VFSRRDKKFLILRSRNVTAAETQGSQYYHSRQPSKSPIRGARKDSFVANKTGLGQEVRDKSPNNRKKSFVGHSRSPSHSFLGKSTANGATKPSRPESRSFLTELSRNDNSFISKPNKGHNCNKSFVALPRNKSIGSIKKTAKESFCGKNKENLGITDPDDEKIEFAFGINEVQFPEVIIFLFLTNFRSVRRS
jgi:hypothetical protein